MKKTILTIVMAMLCFYFKADAQSQYANIKPLTIGDTIPEEVWRIPLQVVNHPEGKKTITLGDYKGKLIILDFWATWCGSCISSIKEFMLTKAYTKNAIAYFGVSYQDHEAINKFKVKHNLYFLSIISDSILSEHFPHRLIPHIVVLKDSKVLSIAGPEILKEENVGYLLNGENLTELAKADILDFDKTKDIQEQMNETFRKSTLFKSTVLSSIPGLSSMNIYSKNANEQKIIITNKSLIESIYLLSDSYWHNRIFLNVQDPARINYLSYKGKLSQTQWLKKYGMGIEAHTPLNITRNTMFNNALKTLLNAHGYEIELKKKDILTYVIYKENKNRFGAMKKGTTVKDLLCSLNYQPLDKQRVPIYIANSKETELDRINVDLSKIRDENYLNIVLKENGLKIIRETRNESIIEVTERAIL
ncbi:MAG: redoxin domain-containing protein [Flavobacterium sp.]|nr:MAG: redoxin domain-containing protein [Flavobacterium sp.]